MKLTARQVEAAKPDDKRHYLIDADARGLGRLELAIEPSGVKRWLFRYTCSDGRRDRILIGVYGDTKGKFTLDQARQEARTLTQIHREHKDVRAYIEAQEASAKAAAQAAELAAVAKAKAFSEYTLKRLCDLYADHLKRGGKQSALDAANIFKNHVFQSDHAARPARDISVRDVTELLRRLTQANKGRTAAKLRTYLRAAYALAIDSETNADASADLLGFDILANPAAGTATLAKYNVALDRVLSVEELHSYIKRVRAEKSAARTPLLVALLLGGQRPMQLLRATLADVDLVDGTIMLRDPKGRRQQARMHLIPLVGEAQTILAQLVAEREKARGKQEKEAVPKEAVPLFVTGKRRTDPSTLSNAVASIAAEMLKADPAEARGEFSLRDLRRTCETQLAAMGVSSDVRAQIQSHGLGGVQQRHYNRHEYVDEKRAALVKWSKHLATIEAGAKAPTNVVEGRFARKRRRVHASPSRSTDTA